MAHHAFYKSFYSPLKPFLQRNPAERLCYTQAAIDVYGNVRVKKYTMNSKEIVCKKRVFIVKKSVHGIQYLLIFEEVNTFNIRNDIARIIAMDLFELDVEIGGTLTIGVFLGSELQWKADVLFNTLESGMEFWIKKARKLLVEELRMGKCCVLKA